MSRTAPTTIDDAPFCNPSRTSPFTSRETMIVPIKALPIEPRPPPTLLPPISAAVTAVSSRPMPVSGPAPDSRDAYRIPASAERTPETT